MMSAKFSDFMTPLSLSQISWFCSFCLLFGSPLSLVLVQKRVGNYKLITLKKISWYVVVCNYCQENQSGKEPSPPTNNCHLRRTSSSKWCRTGDSPRSPCTAPTEGDSDCRADSWGATPTTYSATWDRTTHDAGLPIEDVWWWVTFRKRYHLKDKKGKNRRKCQKNQRHFNDNNDERWVLLYEMCASMRICTRITSTFGQGYMVTWWVGEPRFLFLKDWIYRLMRFLMPQLASNLRSITKPFLKARKLLAPRRIWG